jgi:hypothetical protein
VNETQVQRAIVQHYRARGAPGVFMCAVPNGGFRRPIEAAIMKATGTVAGVPDLLWIREGQAFFTEVKTDKGRLSPAQARTLEQLEAAGAICEVTYGLDHALRWLESTRLLKGSAA